MNEKTSVDQSMALFRRMLEQEEKSSATVEKYIRDAAGFLIFANGAQITKELVLQYKQHLISRQYAVRSINSMLASINAYLRFLGKTECRVRQLRCQREVFCSEEKELSREEYLRLLKAAEATSKISLIMQTICGTGIRVSELQYFTVENVRRGQIRVSCKNKIRTIFLPKKLRRNLLDYAAKNKIRGGYVFQTAKGKPINRTYIWAQMKKLCAKAGVSPQKVFPHNLRKLFAKAFYHIEHDIAKLADVLGHSSIETTRIYIMTSGVEHRRRMERLQLIL